MGRVRVMGEGRNGEDESPVSTLQEGRRLVGRHRPGKLPDCPVASLDRNNRLREQGREGQAGLVFLLVF